MGTITLSLATKNCIKNSNKNYNPGIASFHEMSSVKRQANCRVHKTYRKQH